MRVSTSLLLLHSSGSSGGRGGLRNRRPSPRWELLGTALRAVVVLVSRAVSGFAAPSGRCCLAPGPVPLLSPAACLSGVPLGRALVRRARSSPVALSAPVGFPVAVVPSPSPGVVGPGFTGQVHEARSGQPRIGLIVPAAVPCRSRGAGLAPRCSRLGPRDEVVPVRVPPASVLGYVSCVDWASVDPVTDASGFPYRPSFDGGLSQCTGAVSCGR